MVNVDDVLSNDATPALTGTVNDPTATIVVNVDGVNYPATNNGDGTWTLADNSLANVADGPHTITVTATDAAGNVGTDTAVLTIIPLHRMHHSLIQSMQQIRSSVQQNRVQL
ncbi:Ig-like domain-containing protein [Acinetobacter sp. TR3]|uniref:Ig-like domain-containing protein n=1 Tax=Acinetobacter sp. TR3 TaxID=3003392 RepID=UPI003FA4A06E